MVKWSVMGAKVILSEVEGFPQAVAYLRFDRVYPEQCRRAQRDMLSLTNLPLPIICSPTKLPELEKLLTTEELPYEKWGELEIGKGTGRTEPD